MCTFQSLNQYTIYNTLRPLDPLETTNQGQQAMALLCACADILDNSSYFPRKKLNLTINIKLIN